MRIAVVNWSRRRVGGTETYLGLIIPELARVGHELALWHERDEPASRERIALPEDVPSWCVEGMGAGRALAALRAWRPDLIYTHSLMSPRLEEETLKIAPAVFFAHAYYGTCISGGKAFKRPGVVPCDRRFGWECLLKYYPHRCGGLSPLTMVRLFRLQSKRLELLRRYEAILTHSSHMHAEYLKHGLPPSRVFNLSYYAHGSYKPSPAEDEEGDGELSPLFAEAAPPEVEKGKGCYDLLFLGRMELLKGGGVFVESLRRIREGLGRPVRVTFAGDGPERKRWEREAAKVARGVEGLEVRFVGWLERTRLDEVYAATDLLVFPSLWPEPFGLVGPEAGLRGVPVAAFDVGGVSDWLVDGVNGHLAPGDPPTPAGLAGAVVKALRDPEAHRRLRRGAVETAQQFSLKNHLAALADVFGKVMSGETRREPAAASAAR